MHLLIVLTIMIPVLSCKHEIPVDNTGPGPVNPPSVTCSPDTVYFQQQVLPIIVSNCSMSGCHDAASHQDGVVLTNYNSIMNTGEVNPGNPGNSKIWEVITDNDPSDRMPPPPQAALTQEQKDIVRKWIMQGAKNNSCQPTSCDTTNVTYSVTVKNIVSNKCQGCHSSSVPSGGIDLSTYTGLKAKVTDGRLWGAVNHLSGYSPMPKGGTRLSDCELG
ncbi:MAG TPA: c-type cytochrome domain-containing protein, partial [Flavisolibacter sp.]